MSSRATGVPTPGLVELTIRGIGVIDSAEVEFGPGLTVITGETGAGKTMVLTGLSLILGGSSDPGLIREGASRAVAEGRFRFHDDAVLHGVEDVGAHCDEDGTVLLSRTVSAGRSRAHLGGRTVPAATLAEIGDRLVAVHGQDDQHRLLRPAQQRATLDRFGGPSLASVYAAYRDVYERLIRTRTRLTDVVAHQRERADEAQQLHEAIEAIDRIAPQPNEDTLLRAESMRLSHLDEIVRAVAQASEDVAADEGGAIAAVGRAASTLQRVADRDDILAETAQRSARLLAELDDLAIDLARYLADLQADPARAATVEERRAALSDLRRRLERVEAWPDLLTDPVAWRAAADARLSELGDDPGLVEALQEELAQLTNQAAQLAAQLSQERRRAAGELSSAVTAELAALAMGSAAFEVVVRARPVNQSDLSLTVAGELSSADRHGIDEVEFMLVSREGATARPLARAASGGERSRIMLALEVTLAGLDPVPTFVFDEVDAGVGGKAAVEVGQRLAALAAHSQVIVVTHLAQVAAFADRHLVVRPGEVTSSSVAEVTGSERLTELARMLAGLEDSSTAAAHAAELVDVAARRAAGRN